MAYKFYNAYLNVATSPSQQWKDDLQALINDQFDNASDVYIIQEELEIGAQVYSDINVRITHIINANTGQKLGDDWRNIVFKDLTHVYGLGHRYQFNNYTWLTVNSDIYKYVTASAIIRRCNYILKWFNDVGKLIEEPCIVDYFSMSMSNTVDETKNVRTGANMRYIYLQNNTEAYKILRDRRFIIDRRAYRVVDFDSVTMPGLYELILEEHQINPSVDDVINGIANAYGNSIYTLNVTPKNIEFAIGTTPVQLQTEVKLDGTIINNPSLVYTSSNTLIATVSSTGVVTPISNGSTVITVSLSNNSNVKDNSNVLVTLTPSSNISEKINGNSSIETTMSSDYSIYRFNNGVNVGHVYTFSLNNSFATLTNITGNTVTIVAGSSIGSVILSAINTTTLEVFTLNIDITSLW